MEWVRGGTWFPDVGDDGRDFGGVALFVTFWALDETGFWGEWRILEGWDADGIEEEPLAGALEMTALGVSFVTAFGEALLSEPILPGAVFGVCFGADCGFFEGIPLCVRIE